jgi:hypothetical protein
MLKGALIVWSTNWSYFEKHHKTQQLEKLSSYHQTLKTKLLSANSALYQSTLNGLSMIVNPSKYIGMGFLDRLIESLPTFVSDVFGGGGKHELEEDLDPDGSMDSSESLLATTGEPANSNDILRSSTNRMFTRYGNKNLI